MRAAIDQTDIDRLRGRIRDIPDFPQPGILFRDITPMLADAEAFRAAVQAMARGYAEIDAVVAIESRGFILGAPVAFELGVGLIPVRKVGRLPYETIQESYALEYGASTVEMHRDAVRADQRVLIVDDLLATGGTVRAAANLVEKLGATVAGVSVLAELVALGGRDVLREYEVRSLVVY